MALGPYRALVTRPGVARLLLSAVVGRMPAGMAPLAIVLGVQAATGSYALAGLVTGAFTVASSLVAPVQGRLVDRLGQTRVLLPCCAVFAAGFGGLALAVAAGAGGPLLVACALVGGVGSPAPSLGACMRVLWPAILRAGPAGEVEGDAGLQTAYALESTVQELIFIGGPLIVGLCVALVSPLLALAVTAGIGALGTVAFATSRASRAWRSAPRERHDWAGPLRAAGPRTLVAVAVPVGCAVGGLEVAVAAFAQRRGVPAAAGGLLALWSIGSMAGGLWYGGRPWATPVERRYLLLGWLLAVGLALPPLVATVWQMGGALLPAGVFIAPWLACTYLLVDRLAPAGTVTEAFTWTVTGFLAGLSIGAALAGTVVEGAGVRAALAAPVVWATLAALVSLARRRTLAGPPARPA